MLDVCLLGTGGMMPLPYRWLTSLMTRCEGSHLLIDCGEGTQIAIKEKGWSFKQIDAICFTHYHADHISGLPGILLTMGNAERTEPVTLIGPKGLERVVNCLRAIAPELPFELKFIELNERVEELKIGPYYITAFRVNHNVVCYGYTISLKRAGKFQLDKALAQEIPQRYWSLLQKGQVITDGDNVYTPDMVMGAERKGLKVTYCTDSRPVPVIAEQAAGADIFICEGMYGEKGMEDKAKDKKHMTFYEAAQLAKAAEVNELWLTHFSPSLNYPDEYIKDVRKIFKNTYAGKDGQSVELRFSEEE